MMLFSTYCKKKTFRKLSLVRLSQITVLQKKLRHPYFLNFDSANQGKQPPRLVRNPLVNIHRPENSRVARQRLTEALR